MPVLDYNLAIDRPAAAGTLATLDNAIIWTFLNATDQIAFFGLAFFRGTNVKDVIPPVDANSVFEGISMATDTYEKRDGYTRDPVSGRLGYPKRELFSLVRRGMIWVFVDGAVTRGAPAFVRHTENVGVTGLKGCFRADADSATAVAVPGNSRFYKSAAAPAAGKMNIALLDLRTA